MPIYTGFADADGNFNISFGSNSYSAGEKVIVTAEKDNAMKTIELHAPSEVGGGGVIQFSGTLNDFPLNIGVISLVGLAGALPAYAFAGGDYDPHIFRMSTGLIIGSGVTELGEGVFLNWMKSKSISLPTSLTKIGVMSFYRNTALQSVDLHENITNVGDMAFGACPALTEVIVRRASPPVAGSTIFNGAHSSLIIRVPASSVAAYQAAQGWSTYAAKIQAI